MDSHCMSETYIGQDISLKLRGETLPISAIIPAHLWLGPPWLPQASPGRGMWWRRRRQQTADSPP